MRNGIRALTACFTIAAMLITPRALLAAASDPLPLDGQHVVNTAMLQQALADRLTADAGKRKTIDDVLTRPEAQAAAARLGVDIADARSAVAQLDGAELERVAAHAAAVQADLAGGQRTIVISVTTLLLIIIIILLVAD